MLIKEKDCVEQNIRELTTIQESANLSSAKLAKIERELKLLTAGNNGEQDSAYFIDFYYKQSQNWAVIHDLRIEYGDRVAQIDHLLINRFFDFYVLETKSYRHGIKITDRGEFLAWTGKKYLAIESPVEQNKRHIEILSKLLNSEEILPQRSVFPIKPKFFSYILVSPKSRIIRPGAKDFNTDFIIKADEIYQKTQDNIESKSTLSSVASLAQITSPAVLKTTGENLIKYHTKRTPDYYKKFGIIPAVKSDLSSKVQKSNPSESKYYCYKCKKSISDKVASFCFSKKNLFQGKAYCYDCQR